MSIPTEYKVIGEKHNEGLDFAFDAIRSHYVGAVTKSRASKISVMSKEDLLALGKQAAIDFSEKNVTNVPSGFCEDIINQSVKSATRSADYSVNSEVEVYVQRIKNVLENEPKSPEDLIAKLNKINEHASQNLSEQNAIAVYAGTVTCYNSYIYWKENFMKWAIAIKFPELLAQYSDEELNSFQIIDGELMTPKVVTRSWRDNAWSSVGETWNSYSNSVSNWWSYEGGKEVVGADAGDVVQGALAGAIGGMATGGTLSIPAALAGAVSVGTLNSIDSSIQYWITH